MLKTALILAGGLGTRLRTVVQDAPKPMALIHERPFLSYLLDYCQAQGIQTVFLSVGYKYACIQDYFGNRYRDLALHYVIESTPLGTGGGFCLALAQMDPREPFLLCNGDTFFPVPVLELDRSGRDNDAAMVFSLFRTQDHARYMGLARDKDNRITSFFSISGLANGGVYWVNPKDILDFNVSRQQTSFACNASFPTSCSLSASSSELDKSMDPADKLRDVEMGRAATISLEKDLFPAMLQAGLNLYGIPFDHNFIDIGVPADYYRAAGIILNKEVL